MASEKVLEGKKAKVAALSEKIKNSVSFVLVDYTGITVEEDTKLRREAREANVEYTVEKNSILRFALHDAGYNDFDDQLHGATAIAISTDDETAPARVVGKFASEKEEYYTVKAGVVNGTVYDATGIDKLSKIPSREVLLAQLVGSLQGPIQKLAAILKAVADKKSEDETAA